MLRMPEPSAEALAKRARVAARLREAIPGESVIDAPEELRAYECDGLSAYRQPPMAVVLPRSTEEVAAALRILHEERVPAIPRGSGTSLAGGAMPTADGVVIGVARLNRVLEIDAANRFVRVQTGVTNLSVTGAVAHEGFFYAPDPSSQLACAIAGNIAMNSGGAHCLKYGVTTNNLLGVKLVTMAGEVVEIGGPALDAPGLDLLGLICGSEGQLGVVTEATLRILAAPEGARPILFGFETSEIAGACVADIIREGVIPVALEFMDGPAIRACENHARAGYPLNAGALLIVEVEGSEAEIADQLGRIRAVAERHQPVAVREAGTPEEAAAIWLGRKAAFGAMGQLGDYICLDGTIPVGELPRVLGRISELSKQYGLDVANIFHAGDGNMHPLILFDANGEGQLEKVEAFGADILKLCVEVGGCLTGEHGVGVEKRELMSAQFGPEDLDIQMSVKEAFDPRWLLNPGKVFPLDAVAARRAA
jgi:glycolate oxidase